ncbi:unnamed protein product [Heligmosomoides polygyrus]|uniref:Uncharacterized protein n=1 Tax=Heligmosomoides polygyrus TaxID=6339 RepID=A0A183FFP7_HELPZ|nr:unnamed protein product [Heligmosomoides polygyrus]
MKAYMDEETKAKIRDFRSMRSVVGLMASLSGTPLVREDNHLSSSFPEEPLRLVPVVAAQAGNDDEQRQRRLRRRRGVFSGDKSFCMMDTRLHGKADLASEKVQQQKLSQKQKSETTCLLQVAENSEQEAERQQEGGGSARKVMNADGTSP